jgi:hypothetical protein
MYEIGNEAARIRVTEGKTGFASNRKQRNNNDQSLHHIEGDDRTSKRERRKDGIQHTQKGNSRRWRRGRSALVSPSA